MIAIDVGCAAHGADSIGRIIEEYHPDVLFGFDPHPSVEANAYRRDDTFVVETPIAVWTYEGTVGYVEAGLSSYITGASSNKVACIDIAELVSASHREQGKVVLKLDAEGAEYPLLHRLIAAGVDGLVDVAWVEWHEPDRGREELEKTLACREIREWLL